MTASTRLRPQPQQSAPAPRGRQAPPKAKPKAAPARPAGPARKAAARPTSASKPAAQPTSAPPEEESSWGVYILRCADGTLYTGCTNNRPRRLRSHGRGQVKYTRGRLPVALAYWEGVVGRSAALRREAAIKKLARSTKLALCACAKLC